MPTPTALSRLAAELNGAPTTITAIQAVRRAAIRFNRTRLVRLCDDAIRQLRQARAS